LLWLFFTDKISTNERLHIWYSASLYGPFNEHANNPVKEDIRSARPAGSPFFMDGKLFRPAQDCAVRSGRRIRVNLVTKLSETEFEEEEYSILNPALNSKYSYGMHTLSVANGLVIVDGKQEVFIWQAFLNKLLKKINKSIKIPNDKK